MKGYMSGMRPNSVTVMKSRSYAVRLMTLTLLEQLLNHKIVHKTHTKITSLLDSTVIRLVGRKIGNI